MAGEVSNKESADSKYARIAGRLVRFMRVVGEYTNTPGRPVSGSRKRRWIIIFPFDQPA